MLIAEVGAVLWVLLVALPLPLGWPEHALLFTAWVTAPLGMEQTAPLSPGPGATASLVARTLQPFAAAALTVGLALSPSATATLYTVPWAACAGAHLLAMALDPEPLNQKWPRLTAALFLCAGALATFLNPALAAHLQTLGFGGLLLLHFLHAQKKSPLDPVIAAALTLGLASASQTPQYARWTEAVGLFLLGARALTAQPQNPTARHALRLTALTTALALLALLLDRVQLLHDTLYGFTLFSLIAMALEQPRSVLTFRKPNANRLQALTNAPVHPLQDGRRNHLSVQVGDSPQAFDKVREALLAWSVLPGWVEVRAPSTLTPGASLVLMARRYRVWFASPVRVVELQDTDRTWAVRWATVGASALTGHERLKLERRDDGSVWFEVESFSRLSHPQTLLSAPLVRAQQRAFARETCAAAVRAAQR